ncbi:protein of unknown function [Pseudotevenvirus RB43]|uniref:Uncharacterized protein n=2 Tax=Pseudotevenvirus RB43 TaxID=115991 RepID=Q56BL5_9CAUD|nr:hypothetical protein RB43ORF183c [Escherichia phage RB43]AAX78705.1 hypothetical protein RB43ORF183c [Escherichia phage RB43]CCK74027.1 protein of unknown function [Pseudotevenvirus RB43]CCL97644.1 protein of unknown function [Pseudotevenvirus RB43]
MNYKAGDRVVTIKDCKFAKAGTHGIVNTDRGDILGVVGPDHGKSTLFEKDAVRVATPADPGYYGTREEFESEKDQEIAELKTYVHNARVYAAICTTFAIINAGLLMWVVKHV